MRYVITTDTTCDMPQAFLEENELTVMSMAYTVDGKTYTGLEGDFLPPKEFYDRLRGGSMPQTAQVLSLIHILKKTNVHGAQKQKTALLGRAMHLLYISDSPTKPLPEVRTALRQDVYKRQAPYRLPHGQCHIHLKCRSP